MRSAGSSVLECVRETRCCHGGGEVDLDGHGKKVGGMRIARLRSVFNMVGPGEYFNRRRCRTRVDL